MEESMQDDAMYNENSGMLSGTTKLLQTVSGILSTTTWMSSIPTATFYYEKVLPRLFAPKFLIC